MAGTVEVDFKPGLYHDMQIVQVTICIRGHLLCILSAAMADECGPFARALQGLISTISALLFLGRSTFCVSDKIVINSRPAHQWCFDWTVGISVSIVLAALTVVCSIIGFVGAVQEMIPQLGSLCIPSLVEELRCAGTLTDDALVAGQVISRLADGLPSCVEQSFKTYIPASYIGIYGLSALIGVLSVIQGRNFLKNLDVE